mmetsp:Transcript_92609/g.193604  ORF Transcript_92609/g.193604 Transcript_92609/m.193604 type:complete len:436 (-) Transcript_92609:41-1348(-)
MEVSNSPNLDLAEKCKAAAFQYRSAIAKRSEHVNATDRFYRDLMCYQWRLEAIDMLSKEVSSALGMDPSQRSSLSQTCLKKLSEQRKTAIEGLAERAGSYAMVLPGKKGRTAGIANTSEEKELAMASWRGLVEDTYGELEVDGQALLRQASELQGLEQISSILSRRQQFWTAQLEEVWDAWHQCTSAMYAAGEEAAGAWEELVQLISTISGVHGARGAARALPWDVLEALSSCVVAVIGVDLWDPVGLCGWEAPGIPRHKRPVEARRNALRPILSWIRRGNGLESLGIALLEEAWPDCPNAPPPPAAAALEAYRGIMREALVRVLWKAGKDGEPRLALEVLEFCADLDDLDLADDLRALRNSSGKTADELALAVGSNETAALILEWPDHEPLQIPFEASKLEPTKIFENYALTGWKLESAYEWLRDSMLPSQGAR